MKKYINIEDTRFIFKTNLSGDPSRDRFGSTIRRVNLIVPEDRVAELQELGVNVKTTKPKEGYEEEFEPTHYVVCTANYKSDIPPKIYLVRGNHNPVLMSEDTLKDIDNAYITNVCATLNPYFNKNTNRTSLYITTMYAETDDSRDPYMQKYLERSVDREEDPGEDTPF